MVGVELTLLFVHTDSVVVWFYLLSYFPFFNFHGYFIPISTILSQFILQNGFNPSANALRFRILHVF